MCFQGRWLEAGLVCSGAVTLPGTVCLYEREKVPERTEGECGLLLGLT